MIVYLRMTIFQSIIYSQLMAYIYTYMTVYYKIVILCTQSTLKSRSIIMSKHMIKILHKNATENL